MKYYLQLDGKEQGPLTADELLALTCKATARVRAEDSSEWTVLATVDELAQKAKALPPLSNPLAVWSLVMGLFPVLLIYLSIFFMTLMSDQFRRWVGRADLGLALFVWPLTSILAIIFGHRAKSKIAWCVRAMKGKRMARAGLWLGYFPWVMGINGVVALSLHGCVTEKGNISKAINNCRQIIMALKVYAADHDGHYPDFAVPDAKNSNDVFRVLFKEDYIADEKIFGCPRSPFNPDGAIGTAPDFLYALESGENHWAMTKGMAESSPRNYPLVFENPSEATWPPKWNASLAGEAKPGRTWSAGRIIIGFNDGSVTIMKLESATGKSASLKPNPAGKPVFPEPSTEQGGFKLGILNVAK